jgi:N-acetylglucosaminyldiphosphoundecaprenol N-acetyl-beta-D-mannosaminyltransferase
MNNKVTLFDIPIDALTMDQTIVIIDNSIKNGVQIVQNSINANKVVLMKKDSRLKKSLLEADIVNADGQSIVWSSKILKKPLPQRVAGIDLMANIMRLASINQYKVYLLGAKEEVVANVCHHYNYLYNTKIVVGYRNGYYQKEEEPIIIEGIRKSGAQILFIAIPSPQKELFIQKYRGQLPNVSFMMGVGGSFDVVSGKISRAPKWMQKLGLEWFYRLVQEPGKMWHRYLIGNISYLILLLKEKKKIA